MVKNEAHHRLAFSRPEFSLKDWPPLGAAVAAVAGASASARDRTSAYLRLTHSMPSSGNADTGRGERNTAADADDADESYMAEDERGRSYQNSPDTSREASSHGGTEFGPSRAGEHALLPDGVAWPADVHVDDVAVRNLRSREHDHNADDSACADEAVVSSPVPLTRQPSDSSTRVVRLADLPSGSFPKRAADPAAAVSGMSGAVTGGGAHTAHNTHTHTLPHRSVEK